MKIIGMMPVHNEDWVVGMSIRHALRWVDEMVVFNHASTDHTQRMIFEIAAENPGRIAYDYTADPKWDEMAHRQLMLEVARGYEATHMAIIDADEVISTNIIHTIRRDIEALNPGQVLQVPIYNLRHGILQYHSNGVWANGWTQLAFCDHPDLCWQGDRFHHREPFGAKGKTRITIPYGSGGVMHLWGVSEKKLVAKHRLYRITERLRWPDKPVAEIERIYSMATCGRIEMGDTPNTWTFAAVPPAWWDGIELKYLDLNQPPWQDAECERLIAQYGSEHFAGLSI